MTGAYMGVSLDSNTFSRSFVSAALPYLVQRHDQVLIVLADELMLYTRSVSNDLGQSKLCLPESTSRIAKRANEIARFIDGERKRLSIPSSAIRICRWLDFADGAYSSVLRRLHIAFSLLTPLRQFVEFEAARHRLPTSVSASLSENWLDLNVHYVLDEAAMAIRITELGNYPHEYYPGEDIRLLSALYSRQFDKVGLTVEALIGHQPTRTFRTLDY